MTNDIEKTIAKHLNDFEKEFCEIDKIIIISKGNDIRLLIVNDAEVNYIG